MKQMGDQPPRRQQSNELPTSILIQTSDFYVWNKVAPMNSEQHRIDPQGVFAVHWFFFNATFLLLLVYSLTCFGPITFLIYPSQEHVPSI